MFTEQQTEEQSKKDGEKNARESDNFTFNQPIYDHKSLRKRCG